MRSQKIWKNLPLSGSETFHKVYNSARRKEENCNSLAGIETSHLCYAMIQVILNEIDSLFFQIKDRLLWEDKKNEKKIFHLGKAKSRKIAIVAGIGTAHLCYTKQVISNEINSLVFFQLNIMRSHKIWKKSSTQWFWNISQTVQ